MLCGRRVQGFTRTSAAFHCYCYACVRMSDRAQRDAAIPGSRVQRGSMTAPATEKRCPTCCEPGDLLFAAAFYQHPSRADGLSSQCRACHHEVQRRYYDRNSESERARTRRRVRSTRRRTRLLVLRYLESHPCVDCGERDPVVLQFHHVRGTKRDNVGSLVADSYEWHIVETEIAKCVVLCANCHTRRTALSRGHYRACRARRWVNPDVRTGRPDLATPTREADTLGLKRSGTTSATAIDDPTVV